MAKECQEVITMEPVQQENPTYQRDENGEEILIEGQLDKGKKFASTYSPPNNMHCLLSS